MRKPVRINNIKNIIVSPCDGLVTKVDNNHISIFLAVFDVHWQYAPVDSTVKSIETISGGYKMATEPESSHNEGVKVVFSSKFQRKLIFLQKGEYFQLKICHYL